MELSTKTSNRYYQCGIAQRHSKNMSIRKAVKGIKMKQMRNTISKMKFLLSGDYGLDIPEEKITEFEFKMKYKEKKMIGGKKKEKNLSNLWDISK